MKDEEFLRCLSASIIHQILMRARQREYYASHKEQCKGYVDPEKAREATRQYWKRHPEKAYANAKRWRQNNPDKAKESVKRWQKSNPDKVKIIHKRKAFRKRNAEGNFTLKEWNAKLEEYNYKCAYCGCELSSDTITVDHRIPLSRGGTNYIGNLVPACKSCNSKKHTKTSEEYLMQLEGSV